MDLRTPIKDAGRIYKIYSRRLEKIGIKKIEDFLYHIPFRYDDYSLISKINKIQTGEIVTIRGIVKKIENIYTRNHKKIEKALIGDDTGEIEVVWFNQPYLTKTIHKEDFISLSGKIEEFRGKKIMQSPEYELAENGIHTGRLVPVYAETKGLTSKWIRRQVFKILSQSKLEDFLPELLIKENNFLNLYEAIEKIHFPKNLQEAGKAKDRLGFDELFITQLKSLKKREQWNQKLTGNKFFVTKFKKQIEELTKSLPFELTLAQKKAIKEIFADLEKEKPMNRLLEGDVGSGKTVIAAIIIYLAYLNGFQSALMTPTEILAQQHYNTINKLLSPFKVKVGLITGTNKNKKLSTDVLIGTHAILSKKINFDNLGLVIIDEQQRFGVEQRTLIRKKGKNPHFLTMTATPIPRTVALTMYADLQLSYLDEMPIGRKKVITWLVPPEKREGAYNWISRQIDKTKSQAFIVCPFIEESENIATVKAATKEYERLKEEIFKKYKLGLLHGKIRTKEKDKLLIEFKNKKIDILVATPVVEVGIDIPNATIMMIEGAERFGLAQLHQLRGRVGRGEKQSYCLLFTDIKSEKVTERLKTMEKIHDGAKLAEADLRLRGPGEIFGTAQHGIQTLKIASFFDFELIKKTKTEAERIFPELSKYPELEQKIIETTIIDSSPD